MGKKPLVRTLAVAYTRVSTDTKVQELGAAAQRAAIERYAAEKGLTIVHWAHDDASGGSALADRPGLLGAAEAVRQHRAGVLLVAKRDRFTRDALQTAAIELELRRMGAEIVAADGQGNGRDAGSKFMAKILDGAAEYERERIRGRIVDALAVKKARGERVGTVPFGFQLATDGVHLEPNAAEQEALATIRALRASGLTLRAVQEALVERGVMNRQGKPFALPALHKMTQV